MKEALSGTRSFIQNRGDKILISKKGLSEIVATLLIILVTLIAVSIIWVVVKNVIEKGADEIDLASQPINLQIQSVVVDGDAVTVTVVVRRSAGEGDFTGMDFVFSDGVNSETIRQNTVIDELDVKSFVFTLTKINGGQLNLVSVVPVYIRNGKETLGSVADNFDVKKNQSIGAETGTGATTTGNFAALGYSGLGYVGYNVNSGSIPTYPVFKHASVDPLDVMIGQMQTFNVTVYSPNTITNVTSVTQLDTSTLNLQFNKIGTDSDGELWSASWTAYDTHATSYTSIITAKDSMGNQNDISLTWTDAVDCYDSIPSSEHGSDYVLSTNCTFMNTSGAVSGLMGGILTFSTNAYMIQKNAIIVTKGFDFSGGSLVTPDDHSATIYTNGWIYYVDGDGDTAATNSTRYYSATAPGAGTILINKSIGTDCSSNASAYPGQTTYFFSHRGDNSWDYNCDSGVETKNTTGIGSVRTCTWNGDSCTQISAGAVGWQTSEPSCGSSGTYYDSLGLACNLREQIDCTEDLTTSSSRTQACR